MSVDHVSALVRALSFIALFQAAGVAIFVAIFGRSLDSAEAPIRALGLASAIVGLVLVSMHYTLEAARMAGALSGALDMSLQRLVFDSSMSTAWGLRTAGLVLIALTITRKGRLRTSVSLGGVALTLLGFLFVGHTAMHSHRGWLGILLSMHLAIVAFWFGALLPLFVISRKAPGVVAARIVDEFSRLATWLVPGIFLAGVLLTAALVDRWAVFRESYGIILLAKSALFAGLMGLAALNKWRYGPALAVAPGAAIAFQRAVAAEYLLVCGVLAATAVMTTFFSPEA